MRVLSTESLKRFLSKILLAILFTREDVFLLIDEPTNHLDMDGRKIVSEYLKGKHFNMFY
jgi:ATPase subunit of ABC transporter with duplicated ATPase domains